MIGNRLKQLRKAKNKNVSDMAKILEVSERAYSSYEREERKISIEHLEKIHNLCNCNLNWLVAGVGEMFNTPTSNEDFRTSEMISLIDEALKRHGLIK